MEKEYRLSGFINFLYGLSAIALAGFAIFLFTVHPPIVESVRCSSFSTGIIRLGIISYPCSHAADQLCLERSYGYPAVRYRAQYQNALVWTDRWSILAIIWREEAL